MAANLISASHNFPNSGHGKFGPFSKTAATDAALWVVLQNGGAGDLLGDFDISVFKSTDHGATWSNVATLSDQAHYDQVDSFGSTGGYCCAYNTGDRYIYIAVQVPDGGDYTLNIHRFDTTNDTVAFLTTVPVTYPVDAVHFRIVGVLPTLRSRFDMDVSSTDVQVIHPKANFTADDLSAVSQDWGRVGFSTWSIGAATWTTSDSDIDTQYGSYFQENYDDVPGGIVGTGASAYMYIARSFDDPTQTEGDAGAVVIAFKNTTKMGASPQMRYYISYPEALGDLGNPYMIGIPYLSPSTLLTVLPYNGNSGGLNLMVGGGNQLVGQIYSNLGTTVEDSSLENDNNGAVVSEDAHATPGPQLHVLRVRNDAFIYDYVKGFSGTISNGFSGPFTKNTFYNSNALGTGVINNISSTIRDNGAEPFVRRILFDFESGGSTSAYYLEYSYTPTSPCGASAAGSMSYAFLG